MRIKIEIKENKNPKNYETKKNKQTTVQQISTPTISHSTNMKNYNTQYKYHGNHNNANGTMKSKQRIFNNYGHLPTIVQTLYKQTKKRLCKTIDRSNKTSISHL